MTESSNYQTYATSLLADFRALNKGDVPRQEVLTDWLEDFLLRARRHAFTIGPTDVENLNALDDFVRLNRIPATARAALA
ncbi:MAG TPA: hypothetical protein VFC28_11085 [Opitutaceae bacterium]|jgi:hypothetical protein|nr:hypothetical protein [Opitutaceae bacterium]